ncbi:hypothetical protein Acr_00g0005930 [Actinidia rufa]|uniref:Retrotransposon gag domain-containing protein n=1 Tax=Actinidia rufa TaxID=165716 RepID=A0A7J0D9P6_9ERIC|nr:hypothetical protein Acr_00g0005930 [Actinidia rufa]
MWDIGGPARYAQRQAKLRRRFAHDKINGHEAATRSKVILASSALRTVRSERKKVVPRYQTPFSQEIEGLDPLEKFTPLRFTIYDDKSDPRSHLSHVRQMMALWNHMDALMCRVFPSSLGDLRLKWFDKLPVGSIKNFHYLTESFVARFVINKKAPKVVGSLLTLRKGKGDTIYNYSKRYWETYNEIKECSEELAVMFSQLKDDVKQAEKATWTPNRREGPFKKCKENSIDPNPWLRTSKNATNNGGALFHEERGHKMENYRALKEFLDQLVRDGHLKEFMDDGKTQVEKTEVRPNPRFNQGGNEGDHTVGEYDDLPLGTIHMMGSPHYPDLKNIIQGEIRMIKQMHTG